MASIKLKGDTSGEVTISAPAVAGTTTLELPATSSTLATQNALGVRNLIINGDMRIAQRGTSVSGQTVGTYHTVDRWRTISSGSTYNQSQETITLGDSVVGDFQYYLKHDVTTGDNNAGIYQKIEDVRTVKEGTATLSFYAKGTNPNGGSVEVLLRQTFGTSGSSDVDQPRQSFTLTSSWQKFNFTFTVPSLSGKTIGSNSTVDIYIIQPEGDTSTNAWELNITGIQLEVGDTATPFEHRPYDMELARCQRYFHTTLQEGFKHGISGRGSGNWHAVGRSEFPVPMRANPTINAYAYGGQANAMAQFGDGRADNCTFYTDGGTTGYPNHGGNLNFAVNRNGIVAISSGFNTATNTNYFCGFTASAEL